MASEALMERARELAERGRYTVAPNPMVGVVVSVDGEPVGEGYHVRAGDRHAEIHALDQAGAEARGATMHVTLEPCNHHGRTPPCTEAILRSGVSKVVTGYLDPDPRMRGRSVELLREAGIEIEVVGGAEFEVQNEQFFHYMRTGKPFVHLKLAMSLDGRIAASGGDSKWITTEASRHRAHLLRAEAGAVLIGAGTARNDDPLLLPRNLPDEPPRVTRAVLDSRLTTPLDGQLVATSQDAPVILFASQEAPQDRVRQFERAGVEIVGIQTSETGLDVDSVLEELGARGIRGVLVEGGGETASHFLKQNLVDKATLFYAPKVLGAEGVPAIGNLDLKRVADASQLGISDVEQLDGDLAVTLYPKNNFKEGDVHRAN
ncbi:MAG: bifunctional diaminohydroxyphosphoribosylaminopyrimidine deaminase/5-amino-6-(5-phosphoribosylamino)uracil reductase RibD [Rubrobacteraceae bacterium]